MILIGDSSALIALAACDALEKLKNSRVYIAPELWHGSTPGYTYLQEGAAGGVAAT